MESCLPGREEQGKPWGGGVGAAKKVFLGQCRTQSASRGAQSNDSSLTNVLGLRIGGATVRALSIVRIRDHFSSRKASLWPGFSRLPQGNPRWDQHLLAERGQGPIRCLLWCLFFSFSVFLHLLFPWSLSLSLWPNAAHIHTRTHLPAPSPRIGLASRSNGAPNLSQLLPLIQSFLAESSHGICFLENLQFYVGR